MKMRSTILLSISVVSLVSFALEGAASAQAAPQPAPQATPAQPFADQPLQQDLVNAPVLNGSETLPQGAMQGPPAPPAPPGEAQPANLQPLPAPGAQLGGPSPAPAPMPLMAAGQPGNGERDVAEDKTKSSVLQPWDVDARASLHTTPLLQYGGIGASADAGMRKVGPGTVALGGGLDYFFCGTTCSSVPLSFTQRQVSLEARLSYHLALPQVKHVDFYPLVTAGFMVSRSSLSVEGSEYRASDVAPSVGFGAGASYFFTDQIFVAAEARFRYAAGTYSYELASGNERPFDRSGVDTWSASTVDLSGAIGARF